MVAALPDDTRYSQGIGSLRDLFQYAQSTHFHYMYVGRIGLSQAQARADVGDPGEEWTYAVALRRETAGREAIRRDRGCTSIRRSRASTGRCALERSVYALIEREYRARIDRSSR